MARFVNMQDFIYWSDTVVVENGSPEFRAVFDFGNGFQGYDTVLCCTGAYFYAVAIRDGDVSPVPEPQALAMMLSGLAAVSRNYA